MNVLLGTYTMHFRPRARREPTNKNHTCPHHAGECLSSTTMLDAERPALFVSLSFLPTVVCAATPVTPPRHPLPFPLCCIKRSTNGFFRATPIITSIGPASQKSALGQEAGNAPQRRQIIALLKCVVIIFLFCILRGHRL